MERRPKVPTLILASSSSYRRMLLERLAVPFACISPHIDESPLTGESAPQTALRLARQKAEAIAKTRPEAFVIGSDQVATCRGHRLGKPESKEQALVQLQLQRGGETEFFTAVCFIAPGQPPQSELVSTRVIWRPEDELSDALLERYIELERPSTAQARRNRRAWASHSSLASRAPTRPPSSDCPSLSVRECLTRGG